MHMLSTFPTPWPKGSFMSPPFHSSFHLQSHSCTWLFALEGRRCLRVEQKTLEKRYLIARGQLLIHIAKARRDKQTKTNLQKRLLNNRRASQVALGPKGKLTKHHYCHQVFRGSEEHKMYTFAKGINKINSFQGELYISWILSTCFHMYINNQAE